MYKVVIFYLLAILLISLKPATGAAQQPDTARLEDVIVSVDSTTLEEEVVEEKPNYFNAVTEDATKPITERKVPTAVVDSLKKDDAFWYTDYEPEVKKPATYKPSPFLKLLSSDWFRILLWTIVIGGFIAILVWFLKASDVRLYRKKETAKVVASEGIPENIFEIDYDAEIEAAIKSKDFRQAVRLLYLQTLRNLSTSDKIQYRQERTNSVYRQQLFGTPLYHPFSKLTRHFEFVWYGQFPLSSEAFDRIHNDYLQFREEVVA